MIGMLIITLSGITSLIFLFVLFFWWYLLWLRGKRCKKINNQKIKKDEEIKIIRYKKIYKKILKWGVLVVLVIWILGLATYFIYDPMVVNQISEESRVIEYVID